MESTQATLIHAGVGMAGECGELLMAHANGDRVNLIEEAGDWRFYFQHLVTTFGWDLGYLGSFAVNGKHDTMTNLIVNTCEVLDQLKKHWVYGRELDVPKLRLFAGLAYVAYSQMLYVHKLNDEEVCDANQYKLSAGPNARYPLGYTDAAAIARADKAPGQ